MTGTTQTDARKNPVTVGLFVTCLVDLFRPEIAIAATSLLEEAGCKVVLTKAQSCCGQPGYNSGDFKGAGAIVRSLPKAFAKADYIVVPSGSCAAMLRTHLPQLVDANETGSGQAGLDFAGKSWELAAFLVEVMQFSLPDRTSPALPLNYTYHDSCSGLRELKIKSAPRNLLDQIKGCTRHEMEQAEICCGFGGTFCVKYPELSEHMLDRKLESIAQTKANTVLAGDLGCLMNMAGRARRIGLQLEFRHYAEILADLADIPAIGAAQ